MPCWTENAKFMKIHNLHVYHLDCTHSMPAPMHDLRFLKSVWNWNGGPCPTYLANSVSISPHIKGGSGGSCKWNISEKGGAPPRKSWKSPEILLKYFWETSFGRWNQHGNTAAFVSIPQLSFVPTWNFQGGRLDSTLFLLRFQTYPLLTYGWQHTHLMIAWY